MHTLPILFGAKQIKISLESGKFLQYVLLGINPTTQRQPDPSSTKPRIFKLGKDILAG